MANFDKDKTTQEFLQVQLDLAELYKRSKASDFITYHAMVWYGINGMKCVWMDMEDNHGTDESFSDFMKSRLCGLVDQCESSTDWEELIREHGNRRDRRN